MSITGIILAAGSSSRFNQNQNKNLALLDTKEVLLYSIETFLNNVLINDLIIVYRQDEKDIVINIINKINTKKNIELVKGGKSRKESVFNAISNCNSDFVVIHDGARPLVKKEHITRVVREMKEYKASSLGVYSKDTIKIVDENGIVKYTTDRSKTALIQTPQCFDRKLLLELHKKYKEIEATDDCYLFELDSYKVKIVNGNYSNIKITTYEDLIIMDSIVKMDKQ